MLFNKICPAVKKHENIPWKFPFCSENPHSLGHVGPQEPPLSFFLLDPDPLHSIQRSGGAPGSSGAFRLRGKEVVFFEVE